MRKPAFILVVTLLMSGCSSHLVSIKETNDLALGDLKSAQFIQGMKGGENLYLPPDSTEIYVTDLGGNIYLLGEDSEGHYKINASLKIGSYALGIVQGKDGYLYVNASQHGLDGWLKQGGEVYKVDKALKSATRITGSYKGINGLVMDAAGNLYFSVGDLEFFFPDGAIYKMPYHAESNQYGPPKLFLGDLGSANGLFYSELYDKLLFTETFSKVSMVDLDTKRVSELFGTTKIVEGFDDLCVDSGGSIWVAEPVNGFIKRYEPKSKKLTRFHIDGLGVASSCRTRLKSGKEYIYITEREVSKNNDGRGVLVLPISELISHNRTN